jgi:hypothetical protein
MLSLQVARPAVAPSCAGGVSAAGVGTAANVLIEATASVTSRTKGCVMLLQRPMVRKCRSAVEKHAPGGQTRLEMSSMNALYAYLGCQSRKACAHMHRCHMSNPGHLWSMLFSYLARAVSMWLIRHCCPCCFQLDLTKKHTKLGVSSSDPVVAGMRMLRQPFSWAMLLCYLVHCHIQLLNKPHLLAGWWRLIGQTMCITCCQLNDCCCTLQLCYT